MQTLTEQEQDKEDTKALIEAIERGETPDPELVQRVEARAAEVRARVEQQHGIQSFGVDLIREFRDRQ